MAVIDSGVSPTHPLLKGQVREGRDFNGLASMQGRCDLAGHGTIVAGIIAGRDGDRFWTADHYDSFRQIEEGQ